jgi:hypothetical protein
MPTERRMAWVGFMTISLGLLRGCGPVNRGWFHCWPRRGWAPHGMTHGMTHGIGGQAPGCWRLCRDAHPRAVVTVAWLASARLVMLRAVSPVRQVLPETRGW